MTVIAGGERKAAHPYLTGNFAPIQKTLPLTPCTFSGTIPQELAGGQYVRNGGNPVANADLGRDAHWFDGDGMLSGVVFARPSQDEPLQPQFVNQYILTDLLIASITSPSLRSPILPSISTLISSGPLYVVFCVLRTLFLVFLSHLPGSQQAIKRISVANTGVFYHDGRALATCESGPPIRIVLPSLDTVGWYDGYKAEGELDPERIASKDQEAFGGSGLLSFMKEWTTGHPKVDPITGEMILYHSTFTAPYIHYSVLPAQQEQSQSRKLINLPIPGVSGAKMAHDFGVSTNHTIIMDLSLILNPLNLLKNKPVVEYNPSMPSRFGVLPRRNPTATRWFETKPCCIFHTANTWDQYDARGNLAAVNMLACRLTSASVVYNAGNISKPSQSPLQVKGRHYVDEKPFEYASAMESERQALLHGQEEEQCRLYFYSFDMQHQTSNRIAQQFALSAIPFEFPTLHPGKEMSAARYIYGCSTSSASFDAALGRSVKIDVIAKIDALTLIESAQAMPPHSVTGCVDKRTVPKILRDNVTNADDPVRCFQMPNGWYAQEARFVPRQHQISEDDGFLLFYAFDESQLDTSGECLITAVSELWVIDAKNMRDIVCRIKLPQRVPYGLHGQWFTAEQIAGQRGVYQHRTLPEPYTTSSTSSTGWSSFRHYLISSAG